MPAIQPHYLTLAELLANRLFRIPEYQRAYSWEQRQRSDLFDDIRKTLDLDEDRQHYMATIVGLRRKNQMIGTDNHKVIEIVDGQQRLTTLIILLKAIQKFLSQDVPLEKKIADDLQSLLVKPSDGTLLLLQTNHDTTNIFRNYLIAGAVPPLSSAKTIAERHLVGAIADCEVFINSWVDEERSAVELLSTIKNRLAFIMHETEDERSVYTVFEVLNSRGLDVSSLDRLKSILMGLAFEVPGGGQLELLNELRVIWTDIYACIGLRQGMSTEALRFAATLHLDTCPRRPLGEEDSVEAFKQKATTPQTIASEARWLLKVTEAYDWVQSKTRLAAITNIQQARILLVAIRLRDDLADRERSALINLWEKVTFRVYIVHDKDSRTRVGDYIRLAWEIANEKLDSKAIQDRLKTIGLAFPMGSGINLLRGADCYTDWQDVVRYIFWRREEALSRDRKQNYSNEQWEKIWLSSASDSIEHIWPQSDAPDSHVHSLGNLVVLPPRLNSKLGAMAPMKKRPEYTKTGLLVAQEVADQFKRTWQKSQVEKREKQILNWMVEEWG